MARAEGEEEAQRVSGREASEIEEREIGRGRAMVYSLLKIQREYTLRDFSRAKWR